MSPFNYALCSRYASCDDLFNARWWTRVRATSSHSMEGRGNFNVGLVGFRPITTNTENAGQKTKCLWHERDALLYSSSWTYFDRRSFHCLPLFQLSQKEVTPISNETPNAKAPAKMEVTYTLFRFTRAL